MSTQPVVGKVTFGPLSATAQMPYIVRKKTERIQITITTPADVSGATHAVINGIEFKRTKP